MLHHALVLLLNCFLRDTLFIGFCVWTKISLSVYFLLNKITSMPAKLPSHMVVLINKPVSICFYGTKALNVVVHIYMWGALNMEQYIFILMYLDLYKYCIQLSCLIWKSWSIGKLVLCLCDAISELILGLRIANVRCLYKLIISPAIWCHRFE